MHGNTFVDSPNRKNKIMKFLSLSPNFANLNDSMHISYIEDSISFLVKNPVIDHIDNEHILSKLNLFCISQKRNSHCHYFTVA